MTETLTAQIELDKTAEEFRKAHSDRRQLIDQWEHTIEQMQRRDNEMDLLAVVSEGWMDGWVGGWISGWIHGWVDG